MPIISHGSGLSCARFVNLSCLPLTVRLAHCHFVTLAHTRLQPDISASLLSEFKAQYFTSTDSNPYLRAGAVHL